MSVQYAVFWFLQGNGHEEVIACAWDGQTYIIDHNRTVARFQADENVSAFCAGGKPDCRASPHGIFPSKLLPPSGRPRILCLPAVGNNFPMCILQKALLVFPLVASGKSKGERR